MIAWTRIALLAVGLALATATQGADVGGKTPTGVRYDGGDEILLQGFHWNSVRAGGGKVWYVMLARNAPRIAADGFTAIWMPPPWVDEPKSATQGGEGYFWNRFDKNSLYGSDADLRAAVAAMRGAGVKLIYDIVPNHIDRARLPQSQPGNDVAPADRWLFRDDCPDRTQCDDGEPFFSGDADLDLTKFANLDRFRAELVNLRDNYGASGFRFDFVKGYAGRHVDDWMRQVADGGFCIGELWTDPGAGNSWQDPLKRWSDAARCTVFDFSLKAKFQAGPGEIADWQHSLGGNPDASYRSIAVTFVDNHDTGASPGVNGGQHLWSLTDEHLRQLAYAYILTTPGTPSVYWPDMYNDDGSDATFHNYIKALIALRREAGVVADSTVSFKSGPGWIVALVGTPVRIVVSLNSPFVDARQIGIQGFTARFANADRSVRIWLAGQPTTVTKRFACDVATIPGEDMVAVGADPALGGWNPDKGLRLAWHDDAAPHWRGAVDLPSSFNEWKCVKVTKGRPPEWQPGANNVTSPDPAETETAHF
ncbi:alpha-amylase [Luteibacter sp. UNCMF331Sha3.1]|uniref:glucan 1,4-alpha-maltotetraohydrolase domain-containing protein n=1 Tax=Luteibacter sp. UNCMF331Sha3.1 TaxID=1502760 RepID=UPI0008C22396|nr:glucan 1,4-alpha-maltotetraohydrolase domain-containing protein [Luteibacter sp. UNCMF331Sha3.1]SEM35392.1 alpha-amylase [Luteibacter sp. UNCMF331Sha3.1]